MKTDNETKEIALDIFVLTFVLGYVCTVIYFYFNF